MPPKASAAKEKIAVDKTFGMKNKNKSKVVQKYIKQITACVGGAPKGGKEEAARVAKDLKQKEVQKAAVLNSLFNMATDKKGRSYDAAAKKQAKQQEEESIAAGKKLNDEVRKAIIEGIANTIRLTNPKGVRMSDIGGHPIIHALKDKHADTFKILSLLLFIKANDKVFWVDDPESSNPTIRCQADVEAEVAPDERTIEEIIEEKRAALPPGGTPVTPETFKAWKEKREAERLERQAEEEKQKKKKAAKTGGTGLSGRDLFTFDESLFIDDAEAVGAEDLEVDSDAPDSDDDEAPKKDKEEDDDDEEKEEKGGGAAASSSGAPGVAEAIINANVFLEGGDDDLDDLDEDDDDDDAKA